MTPAFGIRPLIVGAGVINGIEVLLLAKTEDRTEDVSTTVEVDAKAELDEVAPVVLVTAIAT